LGDYLLFEYYFSISCTLALNHLKPKTKDKIRWGVITLPWPTNNLQAHTT